VDFFVTKECSAGTVASNKADAKFFPKKLSLTLREFFFQHSQLIRPYYLISIAKKTGHKKKILACFTFASKSVYLCNLFFLAISNLIPIFPIQ